MKWLQKTSKTPSQSIDQNNAANKQQAPQARQSTNRSLRQSRFATMAGTLVEWYDFYLYGALSVVMASVFFPFQNANTSLLWVLGSFGAGFAARPLGALAFGHIGDRYGRKSAFVWTLLLMGSATFFMGLLPSFEAIGWVAPVLLVVLRLVQGFAIGGEYGGAATYLAEFVTDNRRGYQLGYLQTTATFGLALSMAVMLVTRAVIGENEFVVWGWRLPFLLSSLLVGFAIFMRLQLRESPVFNQVVAQGRLEKQPLAALFSRPEWIVKMLVVLFGAVAGQAVIWYAGQFYVLSWLQSVAGLSLFQANTVGIVALVAATPLFVVFGALSDRIGRKPVILWGNALGALLLVPIFMALKHAAGPSKLVQMGQKTMMLAEQPNLVLIGVLMFALVAVVAMVYGPIAAMLTELFPAPIRYSAASLPYHMGNGYFGGFLPLVATSVAGSEWAKGVFGANVMYAGLLFPTVVALVTLIFGVVALPETLHNPINHMALGGAVVRKLKKEAVVKPKPERKLAK